MEIFLNVVSLPSVYKLKNLKLTIVLVLLLCNSLIVSSGTIYKIDSKLIQLIIVYLTTAYLFYIIFNIIVRIYNTFVRMVKYFIKQSRIIDIKIVIGYYIYNIICLILTSILIYKLYYSLLNYDPGIISYLYIYLFFSLSISLFYIDYLSEKVINIKYIKIYKFTYKLIILNICLIIMVILGLSQFSYWNILMKDKIFSDKFMQMLVTHLMESDTITENSDSINVIRQENTNEQSTHYSEETNKNAARQRNINYQSGDRNVGIQSNDNRQTFHNNSFNYNDNNQGIERRDITRGISSEQIPRNFTESHNITNIDNPPSYNDNEEILELNEERLELELIKKHEILSELLNTQKSTIIRKTVDEIEELLELNISNKNNIDLNTKYTNPDEWLYTSNSSARRTTIDDIEELLFSNTMNISDIEDKYSLINKILYNQKMILSKNLSHYNEEQIMTKIYDFYLDIQKNNLNLQDIISKQFEIRDNLYNVQLDKLGSGKFNKLLPVNNLFKINEELEHPLSNPYDIKELDLARRIYKFNEISMELYLQDKEEILNYKIDKIDKGLKNIQEYINNTNRDRRVNFEDNFLYEDIFNSNRVMKEYSPNYIKGIKNISINKI